MGIFHFPNPLNFLSKFDPLHPLDSIRDDLLDLVNKMQNLIEQTLITPSPLPDVTLLTGFYDVANNLAGYIAYLVFVVAVVISALTFRKGKRVIHSIGVIIIIAMLTPEWAFIVDEMQQLGYNLSHFVTTLFNPNTKNVPAIANVLGAIGAFFGALCGGSLLIAFISNYPIIIVFFKFWAPIAYSFSSFGKRSKQFSNLVLSLGLVATILGPAFAVFFIEMGEVFVSTFPFGHTVFGAYAYTITSYFLAGLSQIILIAVSYMGIVAVEGKIVAMSKGASQATIKNVAKVDVQRIRRNNSSGIKPVKVQAVNQNNRSFTQQVGHESKKVAAEKASKALLTTAVTIGSSTIIGAEVARRGTKFVDKYRQRGNDRRNAA